jgi:hypothetical protein
MGGEHPSPFALSDKDPDLHITNMDQNNAGKRAMAGLGEHGKAFHPGLFNAVYCITNPQLSVRVFIGQPFARRLVMQWRRSTEAQRTS